MCATQHFAKTIVIGGGIAGLAATLRLAAAGQPVTLLERHSHLGGKIRTVGSSAGPIDAGPTVLTLRDVFDDLFACAGARMEDYVRLVRQQTLARHHWPDGSQLDLYDDVEKNRAAIEAFGGPHAVRDFDAFTARTRRLFQAFDAPMMRASHPTMGTMNAVVARKPTLAWDMAPHRTLRGMLRGAFHDPRLAQLFARYATYVGGIPARSPALLSLIWQAEAKGVWVVAGGMHKLAEAITELAVARGAEIETGAHVEDILTHRGRITGVQLEGGRTIHAGNVVFAGDPRALASGALGPSVAQVARQTRSTPRSLSAYVHSFAATPAGTDLTHHNVFFDADPDAEFDDLRAGRMPTSPSLYLCALDRGQGHAPPPLERFEIICNAPPLPRIAPAPELPTWHHTILQKLTAFGLTFSPTPTETSVTTTSDFAQMFPESLGSLYGQSPHGLTAGLRRPTTRTAIPGLYLAGGGCHPGAGVPMATLSAQHAAEAILRDQTSTSTCRQMAMRGGMSTG